MADTKKKYVCFIHIEKAGGITLHNVLHENYWGYISPSPDKLFGMVFDQHDLKILTKLWPFKFSGFGGHRMRSYMKYEDVLGEDIFYFTFVRNPLNRYVSHFNWQKLTMGIDWNLEDFIEDEHFHNFQCYRICGKPSFADAKKEIENKFSFVGVMEQYDASMLLLAKHLGSTFSPLYVQSNVKNYGDKALRWKDMDPDLQKKIIDCNREDQALYDYVTQEFFPRKMSAHPITPSEISTFTTARETFRFGWPSAAKRKITNKMLAKVVQPMILRRRAAES